MLILTINFLLTNLKPYTGRPIYAQRNALECVLYLGSGGQFLCSFEHLFPNELFLNFF